jgi:hypothetical protein
MYVDSERATNEVVVAIFRLLFRHLSGMPGNEWKNSGYQMLCDSNWVLSMDVWKHYNTNLLE